MISSFTSTHTKRPPAKVLACLPNSLLGLKFQQMQAHSSKAGTADRQSASFDKLRTPSKVEG